MALLEYCVSHRLAPGGPECPLPPPPDEMTEHISASGNHPLTCSTAKPRPLPCPQSLLRPRGTEDDECVGRTEGHKGTQQGWVVRQIIIEHVREEEDDGGFGGDRKQSDQCTKPGIQFLEVSHQRQ